MATQHQIEAVASAMHTLRPEWPHRSLVTFLEKHHSSRPYRDLAVAGAYVATDPKTKTPELLNQQAPWTAVGRMNVAAGNSTSAPPGPGVARCPLHPWEATRCRCCRSDYLAAGHWPDGTTHPDAKETTP